MTTPDVFHPGDRVRVWPRRNADVLDLALRGQTARVQTVERDYEGNLHVTVTLDADPGRDFGRAGKPGHRFFFGPDELELLADPGAPS